MRKILSFIPIKYQAYLSTSYYKQAYNVLRDYFFFKDWDRITLRLTELEQGVNLLLFQKTEAEKAYTEAVKMHDMVVDGLKRELKSKDSLLKSKDASMNDKDNHIKLLEKHIALLEAANRNSSD